MMDKARCGLLKSSKKTLCIPTLLLSLVTNSPAFADERIVINNYSNCDLKLIYSDTAPTISHHTATPYIRKNGSGVVVANVDKAETHEEIFIDDYLALCDGKSVDVYIVGRNSLYGWMASLEHNSLISLKNANYYNYFGQTVTAKYGEDNHVEIAAYNG